jgi:2-hydroxy-6-oxonona-2,4-dienedioate hydrolase
LLVPGGCSLALRLSRHAHAADLSPAAQADAHAALLDALRIDRAVVARVSAGAPSAVELALRHPDRVRALVLMVPRGYAPGHVESASARDEPALMRVMMAGADFGCWAALRLARSKVVRFLGVPPEIEARAAPAERERVIAILISVLPLSLRVQGIRNDSAITLGTLPLERIRVPALVISARDNLFETPPAAEHLAAHIPGARLLVFESGGHLLLGRQAEVNSQIADFLMTSLRGEAEAQPVRRSA